MNVHSRWCFVLHNAALEGGKYLDKLVKSKGESLLNPSPSSDMADGLYNILNLNDMYSCFLLFHLFFFFIFAARVAASMRSCDSAGSVASFLTLETKWEEGGKQQRKCSAHL